MEVGGGRELVREGIDWPLVACTLLDTDEGWYDGLLGESAYEKLVDFRRRHVKSLRIGSRSKRWWTPDLGAQAAKVRHARRGGRGRLNWETHRREVEVMRAMVKAAKEKCWRDFCTKEGAQAPWGVVRWAKDPFGVRERMHGQTGDDGSHVRDDAGIVGILMRKVFGKYSW